jgi:hypothetical protein
MSLLSDLLDDFAENTNIFRSDESKIDKAAFDEVYKKYGEDVALGYLKCMEEITTILNRVLMAPSKNIPNLRVNETDAMISNKIFHLHNALLIFMKQNGIDTGKLAMPHQRNTRRKGWEY